MPTAGSPCAPPRNRSRQGERARRPRSRARIPEPAGAVRGRGFPGPAGRVRGRGFPVPPAAFAVPSPGTGAVPPRPPAGTDRPAALSRCPRRGAGCPLASTAAGAVRVGRAAKTPAASGRTRPSDQGGSAPSTAACARPSTVPRGCVQDGAAPGAGSAARGRAAPESASVVCVESRSRRPRPGRTRGVAAGAARRGVPPPAAGPHPSRRRWCASRAGPAARGRPHGGRRDSGLARTGLLRSWRGLCYRLAGIRLPERRCAADPGQTCASRRRPARAPAGRKGRPGAAGAARHGRAGRRRPSDRSPERRRRGQP